MTPRICYFGAYDPDYPRNLILRRGLALNGVQVVECCVSPKLNTRQRATVLANQFQSVADSCDVILLAEFNQALAFSAWQLARRYRKTLVIDAFTSLYDSAVSDRAVAKSISPSALRYWLFDWLAVRLAQQTLVDTAQHRDYFASTFRASPSQMQVIPVGASHEWFDVPPAPHSEGESLVLFYGTYIPLHGIETILHAAHLLREQPNLHFEIIGRGQTYATMQKLAATLDVSAIRFVDSVPPAELPALVARADVALGIFGTTEKTTRVVPNKVYQTLALGKPVITADTRALREMFSPGRDLLAIPLGDAPALAQAIRTLIENPVRGKALGAAGRSRMEVEFTEAALGKRLLESLP
jgi:glycosyltransferase involved in cell wall biosynthesis